MFVVIQLIEIINNEETKPSLNVVAKVVYCSNECC